MARESIKVGLLGFGTVGAGAVQSLQENAELIRKRVGVPVIIKSVADIDWSRPRSVELAPEQRTEDAQAVINDPEIDIVIEAIGGVGVARDLVMAALEHGKHVVTSNKELIAKHGEELFELADRKSLDLSFEGSVGGGIPILRPLKESLAGDRIRRIMGIVNGTTNYILTKMTREGREYAEVLEEAQQRGYAEKPPTSDVEGHDAAYKICILASIAFNTRVNIDDVYREGISRMSAQDIAYAGQLGYVAKLLAIAADTSDGVDVRVHPTFVPLDHPLAAVSDVFNAVFVEGSSVGEVMFYGRGAGSRPTGSAVMGDVIETARNILHGATGRVACTCFERKPLRPIERIETRYYIRCEVGDKPGVLAKIAAVFGEEGVSLSQVLQQAGRGDIAEIVWVTHMTPEHQVRESLERIQRLDDVRAIKNWVRVEGG